MQVLQLEQIMDLLLTLVVAVEVLAKLEILMARDMVVTVYNQV